MSRRWISPRAFQARRNVAEDESAYNRTRGELLGISEADIVPAAPGLKVKYIHEMPGVCSGNIIWAERDRGSAYYRTSQYAMRAGRFPANHPCCPNDKGSDATDSSQMGASESIRQFRSRGYWASCFPEGDGITLRCLNGQTAEQVARDIAECFGWQVNDIAPATPATAPRASSLPVASWRAPASNPWEQQGRAKKAEALARLLREKGITAELAELMTEGEWDAVAKKIPVNLPSRETQRAVVELLKEGD